MILSNRGRAGFLRTIVDHRQGPWPSFRSGKENANGHSEAGKRAPMEADDKSSKGIDLQDIHRRLCRRTMQTPGLRYGHLARADNARGVAASCQRIEIHAPSPWTQQMQRISSFAHVAIPLPM